MGPLGYVVLPTTEGSERTGLGSRGQHVVSEQPCYNNDPFGSPVSGIPPRNDIFVSFPGGEPGFDATCGSLEGHKPSSAAMV